ncbi:PREDICTED: probable 4-coumarate--CoA ligase 1 [Wasmannia auropunctata]|uniref:probable 4-coumarate--CoA ligase 1 n=1 Tax=Wasmannia auropunctata TaxID=64793 RepID=UPI0005F05499|nr:PREDICTED: probable 4-coumarate--CoA ligase 1 [Wasmannia auropunctata]
MDDQPLTTNVCTLTDILNNESDVDYIRYKPAEINDPSRHPLVILYSSGTTGMPKGVALSHKNLVMFLTIFIKPEYADTKSDDRILILLPFYHAYGLGMLLLGSFGNCTCIIMSAFEPQIFLTLVQKYKITHLPLVPPILIFLAKHPLVDSCDFRSVRELFCGAAPLAKDVSFLLSL